MLLVLFQAERRGHEQEDATLRLHIGHALQIVHRLRFNVLKRTPDEWTCHLPVGRKLQLEKPIPNVVVAEQESGISYGHNLGSVVGLRAWVLAKANRREALVPLADLIWLLSHHGLTLAEASATTIDVYCVAILRCATHAGNTTFNRLSERDAKNVALINRKGSNSQRLGPRSWRVTKKIEK
jgi:hypothetical protein